VVGGAVYGPIFVQQPLEGDGEIPALGIVYGEVVEAGAAGRGRRTARALPRVQADVVVVTARRKKGRLVTQADQEIKAHQVAVETDGPVEVGDPEVDVADVGPGGDGFVRHE
jgi:hypothetical protein